MLTNDEEVELARSEDAMRRFDDAEPDEVDEDEYGELLARIVELREKRDITP